MPIKLEFETLQELQEFCNENAITTTKPKAQPVPEPDRSTEALLRMEVDKMPLLQRTITALHTTGIHVVGELCELTLKELYRVPDIGETGRSHILKALKGFNLSLKKD